MLKMDRKQLNTTCSTRNGESALTSCAAEVESKYVGQFSASHQTLHHSLETHRWRQTHSPEQVTRAQTTQH